MTNTINGVPLAQQPNENQIPSNALPTQPAYLKEGLLHKKQSVYRLDGADIRWYYTISAHGQVQFYGSVTSILDKTMPTSPYLIKWIADHGVQGAARLRDQKADYGTLMHLVIADYLQQETYNLNMMQFIVSHYVREHRLQYDTSRWAESLQKDLLSFDAFCKEYNVKPLAVEMVCAAPSLGYAGCIDLVCEMTVFEKGFADGVVYASGKNVGQPKEVKIPKTFRAIVDFKSGKHQFYENNEIQANMYMNLWNNCYPEARVERCYNWRPTEWEGVDPTFSLKEQTGVKSSEKIPYLMKLFCIDVPPSPKPQLQMTGTIKLNSKFDGVIRRKPAEEIALERYERHGIARAVAGGKIDEGQFVTRPRVLDEVTDHITWRETGELKVVTREENRETIAKDNLQAAMKRAGHQAPVSTIIKDATKKAMPETIEIVTPLSPENYLTPTELEQVTTAADAASVIDNPPIDPNPPEAFKPPVKTFLPEDDEISDTSYDAVDEDDEVIVPAPGPTPAAQPTAAPAPKRAPSPTLERMKAELAGEKNTNGKLQHA